MKTQNQKLPSGSKGQSHKPNPSSSASHRKSRWESDKPSFKKPESKPPAKSSDEPAASGSIPTSASGPPPLAPIPLPPPGHSASPFPLPDVGPAPPVYGFHNLERRTIALADGSVRSYFALPPDEYPPARPLPNPAVGDKLYPPLDHRPQPPFDPHLPSSAMLSPEGFRREIGHRDRGGGSRDRDYWASLDPDGRGVPESSLKRKYGDEDGDPRDDFMRQRQHVSQYGHLDSNPNGFPRGTRDRRLDYVGGGPSSPYRRSTEDLRPAKNHKVGLDGYDDLASRRGVPADEISSKHLDVDPRALNIAFLRYTKSLHESVSQRKNYLEDGKYGPLQCIVCGRASKNYEDVHGLVMHAYNHTNADSRVEHLGLHKALCVLRGWNHSRAPDNSKAYQSLPSDDATAQNEDLIIWPPLVIVHNTNFGRRQDGRMDGIGNKEMDMKLRDLGFGGGKSKSVYGKEGHLGITVVKFASSMSGLKDAESLAEYFESDNHGRKGWARAQTSSLSVEDDEKNPYLVKLDEKSREKKRIFYGYLGTASDLDKVDFDSRKRAVIKNRKDVDLSD